MVRIEDDIKLDFKDVLIRPKRSTLRSRSQVSLETEITFKHSGRTIKSVPIMAANMDTVGTFEMATEFAKHGLIVCVHKHYSVEDWCAFRDEQPTALGFVAVSAGSSEADAAKTAAILEACPQVTMICLDVANGYSEFFVEAVRRTRAVGAALDVPRSTYPRTSSPTDSPTRVPNRPTHSTRSSPATSSRAR